MADTKNETALSSDATEVRAQKLKLLREKIGDAASGADLPATAPRAAVRPARSRNFLRPIEVLGRIGGLLP